MCSPQVAVGTQDNYEKSKQVQIITKTYVPLDTSLGAFHPCTVMLKEMQKVFAPIHHRQGLIADSHRRASKTKVKYLLAPPTCLNSYNLLTTSLSASVECIDMEMQPIGREIDD